MTVHPGSGPRPASTTAVSTPADRHDDRVILRNVVPNADADLARRLLVVQHEAYAREAELIQDDRIPPLHEDLDTLRSAPVTWVAAFDDAELLGAVAWTEEGPAVDVDRLVVAGSARRRGVGTRLVTHVLRLSDRRTTTVSTGRANLPARSLYERLGFGLVGDREVLPGLWVADYASVPALHGAGAAGVGLPGPEGLPGHPARR